MKGKEDKNTRRQEYENILADWKPAGGVSSEMVRERHPLQPFLPAGARVLFLGSFPPPKKRWSMDFFYPNFINDMWRIIGIVFRNDKNVFVDAENKTFKLHDLIPFLEKTGIALYDTATEVMRLKGNASDKFLEITEPTNIRLLLLQCPSIEAIVSTGQKSAEALCEYFAQEAPKMGQSTSFDFEGKTLRLFRMPSSSRAYPMKLEEKAKIYRSMFAELQMI